MSRLNGHEIFEQLRTCCYISCAIFQSTLRKNVIKELKVFNRLEIFQRIFTNETVTVEAGSHKRREKNIKKQAD